MDVTLLEQMVSVSVLRNRPNVDDFIVARSRELGRCLVLLQVYILKHLPNQVSEWLVPTRTTQQRASDAVSSAGAAPMPLLPSVHS